MTVVEREGPETVKKLNRKEEYSPLYVQNVCRDVQLTHMYMLMYKYNVHVHVYMYRRALYWHIHHVHVHVCIDITTCRSVNKAGI